MKLKKKIYLYATSTTQRWPKEIIKKISDLRFFLFATDVNGTGAVVHLELRISLRIFEKIRNGPNGTYNQGLGETDPCRKPEVENLVALSL